MAPMSNSGPALPGVDDCDGAGPVLEASPDRAPEGLTVSAAILIMASRCEKRTEVRDSMGRALERG